MLERIRLPLVLALLTAAALGLGCVTWFSTLHRVAQEVHHAPLTFDNAVVIHAAKPMRKGALDVTTRAQWEVFRTNYRERHKREPPAILRRLLAMERTCPDFPASRLYDRIQWDLAPWRDLRRRMGIAALQDAAHAVMHWPADEHVTVITAPGREGASMAHVFGPPGTWTWGLWPELQRMLEDVMDVLPPGITFSFEYGDAARGFNALGGRPEKYFPPMPDGFVSFASPRPGDVDPKFDMELDPPAEALRQFMARTCRLSDDQLRNHVFRHSAMHAHRAHEDGVRRPVAIFSQNKVDGCMVDMLFPTPYWVDIQPVEGSNRPWEERTAQPIVWRGTTTGAAMELAEPHGFDWRKGHRIRLVTEFSQSTLVDAKVVEVLQCGDICNEVEEYIREGGGMGGRMPPDYVTRYRHLLDVDGNGWSSRLPMLLWSRALVLRAAVFSSFVDGLLEPWVHYVPVRLDFSDLEEKAQWVLDNPAKVREMVANVERDFPSPEEMYDAMVCYASYLLLEYACLFFDICE